jgi:hypothetical protein
VVNGSVRKERKFRRGKKGGLSTEWLPKN